ncbi:DUF6542 domain-containing protein [Pseudonocardia sp. GCM10023141]|uniref:DUF6542 domain-containing protein n=1 Tax=Pseudonocardia sp. GCM10023141 TaxID=3252653 RepID=UPI00360BBE62
MTSRVANGGGSGRWPMAERSILSTVLGVPPLAAVGLAAVLTALGVFVDLARIGGLGLIFTLCYLVGCTLAVAWVRRRSLFGPMVQPPLLLVVAVPAVVLLAGTPKPGAGIAERAIVIGAPLVNAFPTMAWTTAIAVAVGIARIGLQRPLDEPPAKVSSRPRGSGSASAAGAARGAARTSASPRRS